MLRSGEDIASGYTRKEGGVLSTVAGRRTAKLAQEVCREYMKQLWCVEDNWFEGTHHEGFFVSWRGGMIGALFLDLREELDENEEVGMLGEMENVLKDVDHPLISDRQWKFVREVLAREEVMTLIVVGEVPFVWESREGSKAKTKDSGAKVGGGGNYIQDHWCHRPRQLVHILGALYEWRAKKKGRSLQLVGGSGSGCDCGFKTRIVDKGKRKPVAPAGDKEGEKDAENQEDKQEETEEELEKDFLQIALPPITNDASQFVVARTGTYGNFGYTHSPLPKNTRGYGLIEITLETGDTGDPADIIGTCDARFVSLSNCNVNFLTKEEQEYDKRSLEDVDGTLVEGGALYKIGELPGHVLGMYSNFPKWWTKWSVGLPHAHFEDEVYFRSRESAEHKESRWFVENDDVFRVSCERAFAEFHIDDLQRPENLRTMDVTDVEMLMKQLFAAVRSVWDVAYEDSAHKHHISYLKDEFVFHYTMRKCASTHGDKMGTFDGFVDFVRTCFVEAGVMRMAVLCQHHQEWLDKTRDDRMNASKEAELKKMKDDKEAFERWLAAEEAALLKLKLDNKLDEYQLRTVEKRAKEKEWQKKEEMYEERRAELKGDDMETIAREKERVELEQREKLEREEEERKQEQDEMNRLAEEDVEEYNRRLEAISQKHALQLEAEKEGVMAKRRRLAAERKVVRREARIVMELPTRKPTRDMDHVVGVM